eukprot:1732422-Rhodomonas_salina.1
MNTIQHPLPAGNRWHCHKNVCFALVLCILSMLLQVHVANAIPVTKDLTNINYMAATSTQDKQSHNTDFNYLDDSDAGYPDKYYYYPDGHTQDTNEAFSTLTQVESKTFHQQDSNTFRTPSTLENPEILYFSLTSLMDRIFYAVPRH